MDFNEVLSIIIPLLALVAGLWSIFSIIGKLKERILVVEQKLESGEKEFKAINTKIDALGGKVDELRDAITALTIELAKREIEHA